MEERLRLVQEVAHRWYLGALERRAARALAGAPWQGSRSQRSYCGLPDDQDHGGGRPRARLRSSKEGGRNKAPPPELVDTEGLVLKAKVHSAEVPDEDGIRLLFDPRRNR